MVKQPDKPPSHEYIKCLPHESPLTGAVAHNVWSKDQALSSEDLSQPHAAQKPKIPQHNVNKIKVEQTYILALTQPVH